VTRWPRRRPPESIEPPAWYRHLDPAAWAAPDEQELLMAGGHGLPPEYRRWHAERRWREARREWCIANPEYDWLQELLDRRERRRAASG